MKSSLQRLEPVIGDIGPLAVAVSGDVDSMTLAVVAHHTLGREAYMLHAVFPAVPDEATRRVLGYAKQKGRRLDVIDASSGLTLSSSRVETGISVDPKVLGAIDRTAQIVRRELMPTTARCRVRHDAVVIELDDDCIKELDNTRASTLRMQIADPLAAAGVNHPVSFRSYHMGSAFLRPGNEE